MRAWTSYWALGLLSLSAGCAGNHYLTYYTAASYKATYPPVTSTRVIDVGNANPMDIYKRDFWSEALVGTSSWVGIEDIGDSCKSAAKKLGADLALWSKVPYASGVVHSTMILPNQQTTYNSGMINTPNGPYSYSGQSTTYGTQAVPMSIPVVWYEYRAVYIRTEAAK